MAEKAVNGMYEWRLKAPNGRVVGVSTPQFRTAVEAVRGCLALREESAEYLARITHKKEGVGWVWTVPGPQGRPLARSPRAYERHATCQNAFRKFIALLADTPAPETLTGQHLGDGEVASRETELAPRCR
ncbi:hypothetical protein ACEZDB_21010 [Streptacidiphilus sp. N1-3]|uniref:DUF1508 domain-containing protein n=1 Tax=Streptacidiphilus alkalitolerans TaxID=3342712 RepID=A0ABV6X4D1_9ACTN